MGKRVEFVRDNVKIGADEFMVGDSTGKFSDDFADAIIAAGWAKCVATGECGEVKGGTHKLRVNDIYQETGLVNG